MQIEWDDPEQRAALIESVGLVEYNRLFAEHRQENIVASVNGHAIRAVKTRFGQLFEVGGTGRAFSTLQQAEDFVRYEAL